MCVCIEPKMKMKIKIGYSQCGVTEKIVSSQKNKKKGKRLLSHVIVYTETELNTRGKKMEKWKVKW